MVLPLDKAVGVTLAYIKQGAPPYSGPSHVYTADLSSNWCVGSTAHGGVLLGVLTSAVQTHQSLASSPHVHVAHLTSQFLSASLLGRASVEVQQVSATKRWTRLDVKLFQYTPDPYPADRTAPGVERVLRITAHFLVGSLPPLPPPGPGPKTEGTTLNYFERPCPLLDHPGGLEADTPVPAKLRFRNGMRWKEVRVEKAEGVLSWGAWIEMTGGEDLTSSAALLPFFADVAKNGPELLDPPPAPSWYPTMNLSLDFKAAFPLLSSTSSQSSSLGPARHTLGIYSTTKLIYEGRHDLTVEVWSAPCELGAGGEAGGQEKDEKGVERWRREGSRLLGVSTQMALALSLEVNHGRARKKDDVENKKARL
ncbi:hypothetical protein JCM8547_003651 [Rhodosporidiobolus lusitaniae]